MARFGVRWVALSLVFMTTTAGCLTYPFGDDGDNISQEVKQATAAALKSDCATRITSQVNLGSSCARQGGGFDIFDPGTGEYVGTTHGGDPVHPELVAKATADLTSIDASPPFDANRFDASVQSNPTCVRSAEQPAIWFVIAAASNDPASTDRTGTAKDWRVTVEEMAQIVRYMDGLIEQSTSGASSLRAHCPAGGGWSASQVQVVRLPGALADYKNNFAKIVADVKASSADFARTNTKVVVMYNDPSACTCGGLGTRVLDERADAGNGNNGRQAQYAVVYGYKYVMVFLHELGHILGAVQDNAPYSSAKGHCSKTNDIMCYDDGGPKAPSRTGSCPAGTTKYPGNEWPYAGTCDTGECPKPVFDCGRSTYCNATPAAGTYLAQNWNVCSTAMKYIERSAATRSSTSTTGTSCAPTDFTDQSAPPTDNSFVRLTAADYWRASLIQAPVDLPAGCWRLDIAYRVTPGTSPGADGLAVHLGRDFVDFGPSLAAGQYLGFQPADAPLAPSARDDVQERGVRSHPGYGVTFAWKGPTWQLGIVNLTVKNTLASQPVATPDGDWHILHIAGGQGKLWAAIDGGAAISAATPGLHGGWGISAATGSLHQSHDIGSVRLASATSVQLNDEFTSAGTWAAKRYQGDSKTEAVWCTNGCASGTVTSRIEGETFTANPTDSGGASCQPDYDGEMAGPYERPEASAGQALLLPHSGCSAVLAVDWPAGDYQVEVRGIWNGQAGENAGQIRVDLGDQTSSVPVAKDADTPFTTTHTFQLSQPPGQMRISYETTSSPAYVNLFVDYVEVLA